MERGFEVVQHFPIENFLLWVYIMFETGFEVDVVAYIFHLTLFFRVYI